MSSDEWRQATRLLAQLRLVFEALPTRRYRAATSGGRADWRATLAQMGRNGGEWAAPRLLQRRTRPAPLVVLADISGSMSRYSRMLLHFAHTLARSGGGHVESFVFGTRLTRTTQLLANRDPDVAISRAVRDVQDWSGGTRIAQCLQAFNQQWARRVLGGTATVLLISDGLEHDATLGQQQLLAQQMDRLHKRCRRLLWLNPLLRFNAFEPRAAGVKTMLAHVDAFLPCHNLESLADLARHLDPAHASAAAKTANTITTNSRNRHATQQPTNPARGPEPGLGSPERHHPVAGRHSGL